MRFACILASSTLILTLPWAMAGGGGETVAVTSAYSGGSSCVHRDEVGAVRLDDAEALAAFLYGGKGDHAGALASAPDFGQRLVVGLSMGLQPTPGYAVRLAETNASVNGAVVSVPIEWQQPPADAIQPQVVSWPCMVVTLPRGDYRAVHFVDRDGEVRARLARPGR